MAQDEYTWDVFVSHSGYGNGWVQKFAKDARMFDLRVFVDSEDIDPGANIPNELSRGLRRSRDIVLAVDSQSANSGWVAMELAAGIATSAKNHWRCIVPVRLDDTPWSDLNVFVATLKFVDQQPPSPSSNEYWKLIAFLNRRRMLEPRLVIIHSSKDPSDLNIHEMKRWIAEQCPHGKSFVVEVRPSGSCDIRLIADRDVTNLFCRR